MNCLHSPNARVNKSGPERRRAFRAGLWPDPFLSGVAGLGEGGHTAAAGTSAIRGWAPLPTPASPHWQAGTFLDPMQPIRIAPTEATEASRKAQGALGSGLPAGTEEERAADLPPTGPSRAF